jgi:sensor histidine kinase YesM
MVNLRTLMTPSDATGPRLGRLVRFAALIFATWGGVTVVSAAQGALAQVASGTPEPWHRSLTYAALVYMSWAILTPLVLLVAGAVRFEAGRVLIFFAVHFPAAIVMATIHSILYMSAFWTIYPEPYIADAKLFSKKVISNLHIDILIYAVIVFVLSMAQAYAALRRREVDAAQLEARLAEAEVAALRARMQPHFLFNALNAISALVRKDPPQAERLIARLGELLRRSIDEHRAQIVTLADELDFTLAYIDIEQARLGDRLRVVNQIPKEALSARVPSLLLQPLAENAIRHGIAPLPGQGTLVLEACLSGGHLKLTVKDDGAGAEGGAERLGLGGCRQRLHQLYGDRATLAVTTAPGQGFEVSLSIPQ